jgi:hypothetical protein
MGAVIPTPLLAPDAVHALIVPRHSATGVEVPLLFTMHVDVFVPFPAAASLVAPFATKTTSSSTEIDPVIAKVLVLCPFSAESWSASLQAQHAELQFSIYSESAIDYKLDDCSTTAFNDPEAKIADPNWVVVTGHWQKAREGSAMFGRTTAGAEID